MTTISFGLPALFIIIFALGILGKKSTKVDVPSSVFGLICGLFIASTGIGTTLARLATSAVTTLSDWIARLAS